MLIAIRMGVSAVNASGLSPETLKYKVVYKWGLVHKQAGTATFTLKRTGSHMSATMTARSDPWADKFYKVRDTLTTSFAVGNCLPTKYVRIAHEGGRNSHDEVTFSRSGSTSTGQCLRIRSGKGEKGISRTETTVSATGDAIDLLTSFYYLRCLDFGNLTKGKTQTINIFSGKRKELLTITYQGEEQLKVDKKTYSTHKVTFTFTSGGKKNTSDPIEAWLSTEPGHIPIKLVGELKIGKVQCIYIP